MTLLSWLGLGSVLLSFLPRVEDRPLDVLNRIGVGALSFALLTFAAGWAGALYRSAYLLVFTLFALTGAWLAFGLLPKKSLAHLGRLRDWSRWQLVLLALLLLYAVFDVVAASAPISSPDAVLYHAADPALFERAHRIFEIPWNASSYEPFSVEMLVLDGFLLWNPVQGAFAPLLLAFVALAIVMAFSHRIAGRSAALVAGAIFFAQPFMVWESTSVFIEPGIAVAIALAAWNLFRFARHSGRACLALAGVFAGGAAGMKYLGLIAALSLAAGALVALSGRLNARLLLSFGVPALVVALPWYVKNAVLTGNPFYPHLFGGLNPSASHELDAAMRRFGHGRSPLDFLLLPARLLGDAKAFDGGDYFSPLFILFAPLTLILERPRRRATFVWVAVLLYLLAWFVTSQQARFLVPLMPPLAVLGALGALSLARQGRVGRRLIMAVTVASLAVSLGASSVYAAQFLPVVVGTEAKQQFLQEKVSNYNGIRWLNEHLGRRDRLASDIWGLFYLKMPYTTFGTMGDVLPADAGPKATRTFVSAYGIDYIAILDGDAARRRQAGYLQARLVARVPVRSVRSRTRGHFGPRHEMLVYALKGAG